MISSSTLTLNDWLRSYVITGRLEFIPAASLIPLLGGLLALVRSSVPDRFFLLLLCILLYLIIRMPACRLNCVSDYDLDKKSKANLRMANAVSVIGKKNLVIISVLETAISILLLVYIISVTQNFLLILILLSGFFLALAYTVEPLRLKRRGLLNPLTLALIIFFIPAFFTYVAIVKSPDVLAVAFIIGAAITGEGLELIQTAADYFEERDLNLATPVVVWGLRRTVYVSGGVSTTGLLVVSLALLGFSLQKATVNLAVYSFIIICVFAIFLFLFMSFLRGALKPSDENLVVSRLQEWERFNPILFVVFYSIFVVSAFVIVSV